jgi:membrane-associated phospholipid phosphatase
MYQLTSVVVILLLVLLYLPTYFHTVIGPKPGTVLNDPVLNFFNPRDYSWPIFLLIYFSLALVLVSVLKKPFTVLLGLKCYLVVTVLRMLSMYLITLEPAGGIILLQDPLIDRIAYGGEVFAKDLFFSGHMATLTLLALLEERAHIKKLVVIISAVVALLLIIQRVHYTIDIVASPLITYATLGGLKRFS